MMILSLLIGSILTQGFQCASPEFNAAKLAMKNGEFSKAEQLLEKELTKNTQNGEVWLTLSETKAILNKPKEAVEALLNAEKYKGVDTKLQTLIQIDRSNMWRQFYDVSSKYINQFYSTKNKKFADSAIMYADLGLQIRPEIFDFYSLKGMAYEGIPDQANSIKAYEDYYNQIKPDFDIAKEKMIFMGIPRTDLMKTLGKPTESIGYKTNPRNPKSDSLIIDTYTVSGKELLTFTIDKNDGNFKLKYWAYDLPKTLPQQDRMTPFDFSLSPFASLTQYYYDLKQYQKSLDYLNIILLIDPANVDANRFVITLYDALGKKDEATKRIEDLVKKNPDNKLLHQQYGDILQQVDKYDEAIVQYETALKIDPQYIDALRNIASAYKNKAVNIQKRQKEEFDNKKTKPNPDEFVPLLKKSQEYFEKTKLNKKYEFDFDVISDLSDIYFALDDKDNFKRSVAELEAIESLIPADRKAKYYLTMIAIFDKKMQDQAKSEIYQKKYSEIK